MSHRRKKISGVLTELGTSDGVVDYLVIGIGVNLNLSEESIRREMEDISEKTTSLSILLGEEISRERFCAELINLLDRFYGEFRRLGTRVIVDMWIERWGFMGEEISVDVSGEVIRGVVERVDGNGFLYLRTEEGDLRRVIAGDTVF